MTLVVYQPGYMSVDSISQLGQARSGTYEDWHPPIMTLLWAAVDRIFPGPLGMVVLHSVFFWSSLAAIAYLTISPAWLAFVCLIAIGLSPPVFALLGTVWKDVGLGVSLLSCFSLMFIADRSGSKAALVLSVPLLFYAFAVRHNAAPAVLPFTVWFRHLAVRHAGARLRHARLAAAAIAIALFAGNALLTVRLNGVLTGHRSTYPVQQILLHDLAALSAARSDNFVPSFLQGDPPLRPEEVQRVYTPIGVTPLFAGDKSERRFHLVADRPQLETLKAAWAATISRYPLEYLSHRLQAFRALLAVDGPPFYPFHTGIDRNKLGVTLRRTPLNDRVMRLFSSLKETLFFKGWVYLAATIGMLGIALATGRRSPVRRSRTACLVLLSSSLFYLLAYFFVATSADFRMIWWSVVAVLVSPLLLVDRFSSAHAADVPVAAN